MSYEKDPLRNTIREAIGYGLVPLSIRDHPEITKEFRTAEDADGLVDRIEAALRAEGYVRMNALLTPTEEDEDRLSTAPTDGEVEEIYIRHLMGGLLSTRQLHDRFQLWLREHDRKVDREHRVSLSIGQVLDLAHWLDISPPGSTYQIGLPARLEFHKDKFGVVEVRTLQFR